VWNEPARHHRSIPESRRKRKMQKSVHDQPLDWAIVKTAQEKELKTQGDVGEMKWGRYRPALKCLGGS